MNTQEAVIQIQKTKIRVSTNYSAYYDYLRLHFNKVLAHHQTGNCDIEINAGWKMDFWGKHPPRLETEKDMRAIGANTFIGANRISTIRKVGKKKKLWLNYCINNNRLTLRALSHRKTFKDKMRHDILGQPQESYFFELTYPLVYYPLFWYLEYFKDTHILHASAVKTQDKCIVICGLEGIGKTTLSLSLSKEPGASLFSDNLILYDKNHVYGCYEPIRIHKSNDKTLWQGRFKRINEFRTLKDFYEPVSFDLELKGKPDIAIIPFFSSVFSVREIPKDEFANKIFNINQLTAELGNYNEYSALLNLLVPEFNILQVRFKSLLDLLGSARCYEINMRREDGVERNVQRLRDFILKK